MSVADIIRKNGVILIEDDVYGLLEPSASPIANLIPERAYLAVSLSKCIAPALRVSLLLVSDSAAEDLMRTSLQAAMQMTAPLVVALAMQWLGSETGEQIIAAVRAEAGGRQKLARRILEGLSFAARPTSHHLWLKLPDWWNSSDFVAHVLRGGLAVVGSEAFVVEGAKAPYAVRVSLGAARNRAELAQALQFLAQMAKTRLAAPLII
jgi:DNA-binding transcriptional MocR family regulator